jgi:hypothetical protein
MFHRSTVFLYAFTPWPYDRSIKHVYRVVDSEMMSFGLSVGDQDGIKRKDL